MIQKNGLIPMEIVLKIMNNRPTFIAVDYWEDGEITNVTITLNKMEHWSSEIPPHP